MTLAHFSVRRLSLADTARTEGQKCQSINVTHPRNSFQLTTVGSWCLNIPIPSSLEGKTEVGVSCYLSKFPHGVNLRSPAGVAGWTQHHAVTTFPFWSCFPTSPTGCSRSQINILPLIPCLRVCLRLTRPSNGCISSFPPPLLLLLCLLIHSQGLGLAIDKVMKHHQHVLPPPSLCSRCFHPCSALSSSIRPSRSRSSPAPLRRCPWGLLHGSLPSSSQAFWDTAQR